jgi:UPF0042 nucleotide-binding protein
MKKKKPASRRVVLLTGLSGAGMSTALKSLEDMGYKAFDNLPIALVEALLTQKEGRHIPVAIGIDSRTWDFAGDALVRKISVLKKKKDNAISLLFLDCEDAELQRRYAETRRMHPLAQDRPVRDGIVAERQLMRPVRRAADQVIDTTAIIPRDLRRMVGERFELDADKGLLVTVMSFGFTNGIPREADLVFDMRFLDNPYWDPKLRPLSGMDKAVAVKLAKDRHYRVFFKHLTGLLSPLLPRYDHEGKNYLTIALGCTGGRHRSVFTAERLGEWFTREGYHITVQHRDMAAWAQKHGYNTAKKDKKK